MMVSGVVVRCFEVFYVVFFVLFCLFVQGLFHWEWNLHPIKMNEEISLLWVRKAR